MNSISGKMLAITEKLNFRQLSIVVFVLSVLSSNYINAVIVCILYFFVKKKLKEPCTYNEIVLYVIIGLEIIASLLNIYFLLNSSFFLYNMVSSFYVSNEVVAIKKIFLMHELASLMVFPFAVYDIAQILSFIAVVRAKISGYAATNMRSNKITVILLTVLVIGIVLFVCFIIYIMKYFLTINSKSSVYSVLDIIKNGMIFLWLPAYALYLNQIRSIFRYIAVSSVNNGGIL